MDCSWKNALNEIGFEVDKFVFEMGQKIEHQRLSKTIYPPDSCIYKALELPLQDVKVVILGQDPYHGKNQAHGLSFSVEENVAIPPSLVNIFKEAKVEKKNGNLQDWADQGVLLLNAVLTVEEGRPKSHNSFGWQFLTEAILEVLISNSKHIVFMFWGRDAQNVAKKLSFKDSHKILRASHPSPLGAHYSAPVPFNNCDHFRLANEYLEEHHIKPICW